MDLNSSEGSIWSIQYGVYIELVDLVVDLVLIHIVGFLDFS